MISGRATPEGTAAYAKKHTSAHTGHWRKALGLTLSSMGMGTYLGNPDEEHDSAYAEALVRALELGVNVVDTAINYRFQHSERSVGRGLREAMKSGLITREEVLLCTKGGFLAGDGAPPSRPWITEALVDPGVIVPEDIVAGCHCMTPAYLKHEVEQSRKNLGVETIDVYYVHNPETQMPEVGPDEFYRRLTAAFRALEECVADGKLQFYGTATWEAFRVPEQNPQHVSLSRVAECAREAGGESHHFRVVQLPFNFGMPEALVQPSQDGASALDAAGSVGATVFTSVPLLQGQLLGRLPSDIDAKFPGLETDAQRCLQFARSAPGICAPLCGMKSRAHVDENCRVAGVSPFTQEEFRALFAGG